MSFNKKFYFAFGLTFFVSILSYVAFVQFNPNLAKGVIEEVKGSSMENPFSFIPPLMDAEEISSNYSSDGFERSFLVEKECDGSSQRYYTSVLEEKGWTLEKSNAEESFRSQTFSLGEQRVTVRSVNDPEKDECLVNLVGFSAD